MKVAWLGAGVGFERSGDAGVVNLPHLNGRCRNAK
jgi:hypothetical protein